MESLDTKESSKMDISMGKVGKENKNKEVFTVITVLILIGTLFYSSGGRYEGEFRFGKQDGYGNHLLLTII